MSACTNYWCDNYGISGGNCSGCQEKESSNSKDQSELREILKRRAVRQMDLGSMPDNGIGQSR
jgi:hypothetical protein